MASKDEFADQLYAFIGRVVRSQRKQLEMTQDDLAERLGVSRTSVTNLEQGIQRIPLHRLYRLASILGMEMSEFLPRLEEFRIRIEDYPEGDLYPVTARAIARSLEDEE